MLEFDIVKINSIFPKALQEKLVGRNENQFAVRVFSQAVTAKSLPQYIDHTQLSRQAELSAIVACCEEAMKYNFKAVCTYEKFLPDCVRILAGSGCLLASVVDFPEGQGGLAAKLEQAKRVAAIGADEIDFVIDWRSLKQKIYEPVFDECAAIVRAVQIPVKVILECSELTSDEKYIAAFLAKQAGVAFVKTSTGFSKKGGATIEDIKILREIVGEAIGVKASGGVRTYAQVKAFIESGADRIGCSQSVAILQEALNA